MANVHGQIAFKPLDPEVTEDFYTLPAFNGSFADDVGHGTAVAAMAVGKNLGIW